MVLAPDDFLDDAESDADGPPIVVRPWIAPVVIGLLLAVGLVLYAAGLV